MPERPFTWGIVRGDKIHFGCATQAETMLTWMGFCNADHPQAQEPCARCGEPLWKSVTTPEQP